MYPGALDVARAAIRMAASKDREEESMVKTDLGAAGIKAAAVDIGGEYMPSIRVSIERSLVASKREGVIRGGHAEEGAVAGATREALSQIMPRAIGLNIGGKIGIARREGHICVVALFAVGLVHLNEVSIGLGHRAIPEETS
jgi:hypothetical protein